MSNYFFCFKKHLLRQINEYTFSCLLVFHFCLLSILKATRPLMFPGCYICHSDGTNSWVTTLPISICHTTEIKLMRAPMFTLILNSNQPCPCFSKSAVMLLSKRIGLPFRRMIPDPHHQSSLPSRSHQSQRRKSPSISCEPEGKYECRVRVPTFRQNKLV